MFLFTKKKRIIVKKDHSVLFDLVKKKYNDLSHLIYTYSLSHINIRFEIFLERYKTAQKMGLDEENFLFEELDYIDSLLREIRKKIDVLGIRTNIYGEIAEKIHSRYANYPKIDLGSNIPDEYCYLLGAIKEFSDSFTISIEKLGKMITNRELKNLYYRMEYSYKLIFVERKKNQYPREFQNALYRSNKLNNLDDIHKIWNEVYKLLFNVLMELTRFVNRVYKKGEISDNINFLVGGKNLTFDQWKDLILAEIDKFMTNFRLKGLL